MKDTLIEIKNSLQGNNSRVNEAKNQINVLEHKQKTSKQEKRILTNEDSISNLWYNFKHSNIRIIGVPEREGKEQ